MSIKKYCVLITKVPDLEIEYVLWMCIFWLWKSWQCIRVVLSECYLCGDWNYESFLFEFSLHVFIKFSDKIFWITLKGFEAATSCVRDQGATTVPARLGRETGSLNRLQFMLLQWFIIFPEITEFNEFLFCLGKPLLSVLADNNTFSLQCIIALKFRTIYTVWNVLQTSIYSLQSFCTKTNGNQSLFSFPYKLERLAPIQEILITEHCFIPRKYPVRCNASKNVIYLVKMFKNIAKWISWIKFYSYIIFECRSYIRYKRWII